MDKQIFEQYDADERLRILKENANKTEETTYSKDLSETELEKERQEFAELAVTIANKEEELKEAKESFAKILKPLKQQFNENMTVIHNRRKTVTEEVYLIVDQKTMEVGIYNHRGELIRCRKLTDQEQQYELEFISIAELFPELEDVMNTKKAEEPEPEPKQYPIETHNGELDLEIEPNPEDLEKEPPEYRDPEEDDD
jgi:hypothetical protein